MLFFQECFSGIISIWIFLKGIHNIKDNIALYTNRAQAFIKIGKYQEAISDCDWAFRVFFKNKHQIFATF
jgi:hypothetical protein